MTGPLPSGADTPTRNVLALKPDLPIVITTGEGGNAPAGDLKGRAPIVLLSKPYDSEGLRKSLVTVGLG